MAVIEGTRILLSIVESIHLAAPITRLLQDVGLSQAQSLYLSLNFIHIGFVGFEEVNLL